MCTELSKTISDSAGRKTPVRQTFKMMLSAVLIILLLAAGASACYADLAEPPTVGDVDKDFDITILDATAIQRFLAGITVPDATDRALGDADNDGEMTILDATAIQRFLASLTTTFEIRPLEDYYLGDIVSHSDAEIMTDGYHPEEETAYVGVPVSYMLRARWGAKQGRISLIIDGETADEARINDADMHILTHTFTREGSYTVTTRVENRYGMSFEHTRRVSVVNLPDNGRPVIVGAAFYDSSRMSSGSGVLTVHAQGGSAPYEYCYEVYCDHPAEGEDAPAKDGETYSTGFIPDNEFNILSVTQDCLPASYFDAPAVIQITVKDAKGAVSLPVSVRYDCYEVLV